MEKLTPSEVSEFVRLAEREMKAKTGRNIKFTPKFDGIDPAKLRSILQELRAKYGRDVH